MCFLQCIRWGLYCSCARPSRMLSLWRDERKGAKGNQDFAVIMAGNCQGNWQRDTARNSFKQYTICLKRSWLCNCLSWKTIFNIWLVLIANMLAAFDSQVSAPDRLPHLLWKMILAGRQIEMPNNKMKDGNEANNKCADPGSALGYKRMIYMILAVILVAISITILMSWISK